MSGYITASNGENIADPICNNTLSPQGTENSTTYFIHQVVEKNSKKSIRCENSSKEVECVSAKRNKTCKRRRCSKKSFSHYVKTKEMPIESSSLICFSKKGLFTAMFNAVISFAVSAITCWCFMTVVPATKNYETKPLSVGKSTLFPASMTHQKFPTLPFSDELNHTKRVPTIYRKRVDVNDEKTLSLRSGNDPVVFEVLLKSIPNTYTIQGKEKHFLLPSVVRTLKYGSVITNQGRGMNPNNGKFTAPTHGVYVFYFSGTALSSTYLQVFGLSSSKHINQDQTHTKKTRKDKRFRSHFPNIRLAVEFPSCTGCDFDYAPIKENNNTLKKTNGRCCNQFRGSLISQSFTQVLLKNDQLWLAVVLDHFYVTRATPLRFIGFLQSTLT